MITRDDKPNIDPGLSIFFNGKKYTLMVNGNCIDYSIGSLICEYMRLVPTDLKNVILSCDELGNAVTEEKFVDVFKQFREKLYEIFPIVVANMIEVEFLNTSSDWFNAVRNKKIDEFVSLYDDLNSSSIKEYIFKDTGVSTYGGDSILQLLLTCYCGFSYSYVLTKSMFIDLMNDNNSEDDEHKRRIDFFLSLYGSYLDMQHIDYRLVITNKGFESVYTIKSSVSLLLFEMAHCIGSNINIVKCKNCNYYFVPEKRSDSKYCKYPLRDNKDKTCKDVGAQITRANKMKSDLATKEYRKVYMRYKMMIKRHPNNDEIKERFLKLKSEVKKWRNNVIHGSSTAEEFVKWLEQF